MLFRYVLILLAFSIYADLGHAAQNSNEVAGSAKENRILKKTSELEHQIDIRRLQAEALKDPSAVQYQLGYKDGYNKAVIDLVKSNLMQESPSAPVSASTSNEKQQTQQSNQKVYEWLDQSFDYLMAHDWSKAVITASQAIAIKSDIDAAYVNRSWAYAEKGLTKQAIDDASTAIEINPRNASAYNNRAYAYELAGKYNQAQRDYELACKFRFQPACHTLRRFNAQMSEENIQKINQLTEESYLKFKQKDWPAVEALATQILKIDPANTKAYLNRSGARAALGQLKSALDDSLYAIELDPEFGLAYTKKGHIHEMMGQIGLASKDYQKACDLGIQKGCIEFKRLNVATRQ